MKTALWQSCSVREEEHYFVLTNAEVPVSQRSAPCCLQVVKRRMRSPTILRKTAVGLATGLAVGLGVACAAMV